MWNSKRVYDRLWMYMHEWDRGKLTKELGSAGYDRIGTVIDLDYDEWLVLLRQKVTYMCWKMIRWKYA